VTPVGIGAGAGILTNSAPEFLSLEGAHVLRALLASTLREPSTRAAGPTGKGTRSAVAHILKARRPT